MIFDCFTYFDEIDLLELRLRETEGAVGRWVVAEGTHTHQGRPKATNLGDHWPRLARWRDRIVHLTVPPRGGSPYEREWAQRADLVAALRGLGPRPDDVIAFSDLDEITRPAVLAGYRPADGPRSLEHANCYYWLNCRAGGWAAAKICSWSDLAGRYGHDLRALRCGQAPVIPDAGWHFSFTGGVEAIQRKLAAYLHEDLDRPPYNDERHIRICRATGIDLFVRPGESFRFVRPEGFLPSAAGDDRFRHLWADAYFHEVWSQPRQILRLCTLYERVRGLGGLVVEIGSWEGYSTAALAQAAWPDWVAAVDTWAGSSDESPGHETVLKARQRDVFARFRRNVAELTRGNVDPVHAHSRDYLAGLPAETRIKFAYIDAAHDYASVRRDLLGVKSRLCPGGIVCGDDFIAAGAGRHDLDGGVERAVRECCPGFEAVENLWVWENR
jgi:predicted O-methyltransferase YrrM